MGVCTAAFAQRRHHRSFILISLLFPNPPASFFSSTVRWKGDNGICSPHFISWVAIRNRPSKKSRDREEGFSRFLFLLRRLSFSFFRNVKTNSDCAGGKPMKTYSNTWNFSYQPFSRVLRVLCFVLLGGEISDCFSNSIHKLVPQTCLNSEMSRDSFLDFDWFVDYLNKRDYFKYWAKLRGVAK